MGQVKTRRVTLHHQRRALASVPSPSPMDFGLDDGFDDDEAYLGQGYNNQMQYVPGYYDGSGELGKCFSMIMTLKISFLLPL
jgi:hypothetical protein